MRSTVADVMTSEVVSVGEDTGYKDIVNTLLERGVSALPVVEGEGRVLGVVSEDDLMHKEEFKDDGSDRNYSPPLRALLRSRLTGGGMTAERSAEKAMATTAAGLMTSPAITIPPEASVVDAARLMERRGVKRLPVVDSSGRLAGLISRRDLLRVFLADDEAVSSAVEREIAAVTGSVQGSKITSTIADGVVTLSGSVHHRSTAHMLTRMINRLEGVVSVDDKLTWQTDDLVHPYVGL